MDNSVLSSVSAVLGYYIWLLWPCYIEFCWIWWYFVWMFVGGEKRVGAESADAGGGVAPSCAADAGGGVATTGAGAAGGGVEVEGSLPVVMGLEVGVGERLRVVFQGLLDGRDLDGAAGLAGMRSSEVLALAVAHDGVMDMFGRVVRVQSFKSVAKLMELAVRAEGAMGPVPGLRLSVDVHKFLAVNGLPELLSRTSSSGDRRAHYESQVERRERAEHGEVELVTGVREDGAV